AGEGSFKYFQHIRPSRTDPHGLKAVYHGKAACCGQDSIQYPLLGAASRRFRGTHVAKPPLDSTAESPSALAGNRDVFAAPGTRAFLAAARNRTGHFVGIDTTVRGSGNKFP